MTTNDCSDAETLAAYVDRALPGDQAEAIRAHMEICAECEEAFEAVLAVADFEPNLRWR
jgi:anti-sigma factor RsiW